MMLSSFSVKLSSTAIGASFTLDTLIVTVAAFEISAPVLPNPFIIKPSSCTVYSKLSFPYQFASGLYVITPLITIALPWEG